jgi:hypothetical protein
LLLVVPHVYTVPVSKFIDGVGQKKKKAKLWHLILLSRVTYQSYILSTVGDALVSCPHTTNHTHAHTHSLSLSLSLPIDAFVVNGWVLQFMNFPFPQMEWVPICLTHKACSALEGAPNDKRQTIQKCITCLGKYTYCTVIWIYKGLCKFQFFFRYFQFQKTVGSGSLKKKHQNQTTASPGYFKSIIKEPLVFMKESMIMNWKFYG